MSAASGKDENWYFVTSLTISGKTFSHDDRPNLGWVNLVKTARAYSPGEPITIPQGKVLTQHSFTVSDRGISPQNRSTMVLRGPCTLTLSPMTFSQGENGVDTIMYKSADGTLTFSILAQPTKASGQYSMSTAKATAVKVAPPSKQVTASKAGPFPDNSWLVKEAFLDDVLYQKRDVRIKVDLADPAEVKLLMENCIGDTIEYYDYVDQGSKEGGKYSSMILKENHTGPSLSVKSGNNHIQYPVREFRKKHPMAFNQNSREGFFLVLKKGDLGKNPVNIARDQLPKYELLANEFTKMRYNGTTGRYLPANEKMFFIEPSLTNTAKVEAPADTTPAPAKAETGEAPDGRMKIYFVKGLSATKRNEKIYPAWNNMTIGELKLSVNPSTMEYQGDKNVKTYKTLARVVEEHYVDDLDSVSFSGSSLSFFMFDRTQPDSETTVRHNYSESGFLVEGDARRDTSSYAEMRHLATVIRSNGVSYISNDYGWSNEPVQLTSKAWNNGYFNEGTPRWYRYFHGGVTASTTSALIPMKRHPRAGMVACRYHACIEYDFMKMYGYFESFSITEDASIPFRFEYNISFKIELMEYI